MNRREKNRGFFFFYPSFFSDQDFFSSFFSRLFLVSFSVRLSFQHFGWRFLPATIHYSSSLRWSGSPLLFCLHYLRIAGVGGCMIYTPVGS